MDNQASANAARVDRLHGRAVFEFRQSVTRPAGAQNRRNAPISQGGGGLHSVTCVTRVTQAPRLEARSGLAQQQYGYAAIARIGGVVSDQQFAVCNALYPVKPGFGNGGQHQFLTRCLGPSGGK